MSSLLSAKQLEKSYPLDGTATHALRGVDMTLEEGEFTALMGPSGCGKSTLLHLLGGLDRPTRGEIYYKGRRVDDLSEARLAMLRRREISFLFQSFNLIPNLNLADNVELPALVAGLARGEARKRRTDLLERLGLSGKAKNLPAKLSGGEQQRAALARALVTSPALVLADEPTGSLDSRSAGEVLHLLQEVHQDGQAILLVTHDPLVASAAQRVLLMHDGLITGQAGPGSGHDARHLAQTLLAYGLTTGPAIEGKRGGA